MDRLWAPWRSRYISSKKQKPCIFCKAVKSKSSDYVILKSRHSISILNIFPYNNGHVMVAPLRHTKELKYLKEEEILDLFKTLNKTKHLLTKVLRPDGYNIGINLSGDAGAGETRHLHVHIVPRWKGDTNFMPVLFNTKVIPESLDELYKRLKHAQSKTDKIF